MDSHTYAQWKEIYDLAVKSGISQAVLEIERLYSESFNTGNTLFTTPYFCQSPPYTPRPKHKEFNFFNSSQESDKDLFFGPLDKSLFSSDPEKFVKIESYWSMSNVMKETGQFKSTSEARNNGWNKPIPKGFSETLLKKLHSVIFIFDEKTDEV